MIIMMKQILNCQTIGNDDNDETNSKLSLHSIVSNVHFKDISYVNQYLLISYRFNNSLCIIWNVYYIISCNKICLQITNKP